MLFFLSFLLLCIVWKCMSNATFYNSNPEVQVLLEGTIVRERKCGPEENFALSEPVFSARYLYRETSPSVWYILRSQAPDVAGRDLRPISGTVIEKFDRFVSNFNDRDTGGLRQRSVKATRLFFYIE